MIVLVDIYMCAKNYYHDNKFAIIMIMHLHSTYNFDVCHSISGFVFADDEPSALVQFEGGPCAVIAPVQAFILKNMIFHDSEVERSSWREATSKCDHDTTQYKFMI